MQQKQHKIAWERLGITLIFIALLPFAAHLQKPGALQTQWTTDPFNHQVFIQNNGQFDGKAHGQKVLYAAQLGSVWAYFTANGVVYAYSEIPAQKETKPKKNEDPDEIKTKPVTHYLKCNWDGCNTAGTVNAGDELSYYYTYPKGKDQSIKATIFHKLSYTNIYPGIDVEYTFVKGQDGIKYAIIAHPGADISQVKLAYRGLKQLTITPAGDITFNSAIGTFTDHAPVANYAGESGKIHATYQINGNTESFDVGNYNKNKTLVIDPWLTNPLFSNLDKAYILDWDYNGNVYAYGGDPNVLLQLVKMNSSGAIQWTYNATSVSGSGLFLGSFCTDKVTGNSFLGQGLAVVGPGALAVKVNTMGNQTGAFTTNTSMYEFWISRYDQCHGEIVLGGGGTNSANYSVAATLDTDMSTFTPVNVLNATHQSHDIAFMALDPNGNSSYMATVKSTGDPTHFNNDLLQVPLPSLTPTSYIVNDHHRLNETHSIYYAGQTAQGAGYTNAMNGAAASPSWLYIYNADTLQQINKNTGAINAIYPIRSQDQYLTYGFPFHDTAWIVKYGGIDVDQCDHIFVGVADSMYTFNSTLAAPTKTIMPDTVYDIRVGVDSVIYVCGKGYVTQIKNPFPRHITMVSNNPSSCSACDGNATATLNNACPAIPLTYLWSNGTTTATASSLCSGTYTVTITDNSTCPPHIDTASVVVMNGSSFTLTTNVTNPTTCIGTGSAQVNVNGGTPPYTYMWTPGGQTTPTAIGLTAGSYTVNVKDSIGCTGSATVTLVQPSTVSGVATSTPTCSNTSNGTATVVPSGGTTPYTYDWTPGNQTNATATGLSAGAYTINIIDASGCSGSANVTVLTTSVTATTSSTPACTDSTNGTATATASGGTAPYTYAWTPGTQTNAIATGLTAGTYTVIATDDAGCASPPTPCTVGTAVDCSVSDTLFALYIPSSFSPNGDGLNDMFEAKGTNVTSFEMYIFDRWGTMIFHSTDINMGWDGTLKNVPCQQDAYVYSITAYDLGYNRHTYMGTVTMIK